MKIAILSHWRTTSSVLARQFRMAGMEVGNENTFWVPETCESNTELDALNKVGDALWKGKMEYKDAVARIDQILLAFKKVAENRGWETYGFKVTHALYPNTWPLHRDKIFEIWGEDTQIVTTVCRVEKICWNTRMFKEWTPEGICKSVIETIPALEWIENNGILIESPIDWENGFVKSTAEYLGLNWTDEIEAVWDPSKARIPDPNYEKEILATVPKEVLDQLTPYYDLFRGNDDE